MPKSNRDRLILKQQQTVGAIERAMYHMGDMKATYGEAYPAQCKTIDVIGEMLGMCIDMLHSFRNELM